MKFIPLWLGMLLLCSITACKKEKPAEPATLETTVYGRVVLRGTEQKATNKNVVIKAYKHVSVWFGGAYGVLVAETMSDTNGNYSFSFTAESLETRYFLIMSTFIPNHFDPGGNNWIYFEPGKQQRLQLIYTPFAWIRLHTKNINPQVGDKLHIALGNGENYYIWGPFERESIFLRAGNSVNKINCYLTRLDSGHLLSFETYLPAFDTTYYLLEY